MRIEDCRLIVGAVMLCLVLAASAGMCAEQPGFRVPDSPAELNGFEYAARIQAESDSDYLALFKRGGDYRLAAWTTDKPHKIKLPLDVSEVEIVSSTGERSRQEIKDGNLELLLNGAAQCVEPLGISRRWEIEAGWKIKTSTQHIEEGLTASIESEIPAIGAGVLSVFGYGLDTAATTLAAPPDAAAGVTHVEVSTHYVCSGEQKAKVKVTLALEGLNSPLVRVVELDQSACPMVQVVPPANNELWFIINRPESEHETAFKGTIYVGNTGGLRLQTESCRFEIPLKENRTTARIKLTQSPQAIFSFSYRVLDENKKEILRARNKSCSVIETFADGKAGDEVHKYQVEPDGDAKVSASARFTYLKSPKGAPEKLCAKLDYEFGEGRRFVRISPRPMLPIAEKPSKAFIWIKGDGQGGLARLRFQDSDGQVFQQDYGKLDFTDWRCLEAKMTADGAEHWGGKNDGVVRCPIEWDTIFLVDNAGGKKVKGTICLGSMMLCYD